MYVFRGQGNASVSTDLPAVTPEGFVGTHQGALSCRVPLFPSHGTYGLCLDLCFAGFPPLHTADRM